MVEISDSFKQASFQNYKKQLSDKVSTLKQAMDELIADSSNDSKSTAGDKHETARAMMQIELQNLGRNVKVFEDSLQACERIGLQDARKVVSPGSLILLDDQWIFLIGPGVPEIVEGLSISFISTGSPLSKVLMGKVSGEIVELNNVKRTINKIL